MQAKSKQDAMFAIYTNFSSGYVIVVIGHVTHETRILECPAPKCTNVYVSVVGTEIRQKYMYNERT